MKIDQYCSVCKQSLEMEVVPTADGEDDGVIWLRCPQCQGFLPKISAAGLRAGDRDAATDDGSTEVSIAGVVGEERSPSISGDEVDSEAEESPARDAGGHELPGLEADAPPAGDPPRKPRKSADEPADEPEEPLSEYAALLDEQDPETAVPYRPWSEYQVGDLVHHLAWDDCGVVVAKESLPGNRRVVKVYFEQRGVVRLIEADQTQS